jgi:excisionase family DNA binding protein
MSDLVTAFIDGIAADAAALDRLAAALAPRIAAQASVRHDGALTTRQAAQHVGLHERTVRRALSAGTLNGHSVAGRWRIEPESLEEWLKVGAPTSTTPTHHNGRARRNGAGATEGAAAIAHPTARTAA